MKHPLAPLLCLALTCSWATLAQDEISSQGTSLSVNDKGVLTQMKWAQQTLPFSQNEKAGPRFYLVDEGKETKADWTRVGEGHYRARIGELECEMRYSIDAANQPRISFTLTNRRQDRRSRESTPAG